MWVYGSLMIDQYERISELCLSCCLLQLQRNQTVYQLIFLALRKLLEIWNIMGRWYSLIYNLKCHLIKHLSKCLSYLELVVNGDYHPLYILCSFLQTSLRARTSSAQQNYAYTKKSLPSKLTCHMNSLWPVSCSFLLSKKL